MQEFYNVVTSLIVKGVKYVFFNVGVRYVFLRDRIILFLSVHVSAWENGHVTFRSMDGTCLGIRISVVSCAGKRKCVDTYYIVEINRKSPYFSRAICLEFAERCDRKTKRV